MHLKYRLRNGGHFVQGGGDELNQLRPSSRTNKRVASWGLNELNGSK